MHRVTVQEVLTLLPSSMLLLLQKEPWKEQTQKVRGGSHLFSRAGNLLSPAVAAVGWKWELNEDWLTPKAFILSPEHRSYAMSWRLRPAQVHGTYCLETALTAAATHLWWGCSRDKACIFVHLSRAHVLLILGGRDTFYQVRTRRQTNSRFGMVCCVGYEVRSKRGTWAHVQGWLRECSRRSVGLESYCNTVKGPPGLLYPTEPLCVPGVAGLS